MTDPSSNLFQTGLSTLNEYLGTHDSPILRGIEKEGLRASRSLDIAQSDHPSALGHPLTHSRITTDYSEALLELITSVHNSRESLLDELENVHAFVQAQLGDELLWAGSMPCRLQGDESIRIAEYGDSNIGQLKHVYRQGLGVRYGRIMQSIAGLHFNFSLQDSFWQAMQARQKNRQTLRDFKSDQYFGLIRNFRRHAWLLMYLFGASPALDKSFLKEGEQAGLETLDTHGTLYKPFACSLRMGDLGYHNNAQSSLNICFNTLDNFTHTLGEAVKTPYPDYQKIGILQDGQYIQLNSNILQIENEYYSSIRPKRTTLSGEKPTQALIERGVEYIEVRCLDLNPMLPLGIDASEVDFLDLMLLHALLKPSDFIDDAHCHELEYNFTQTVDKGRDPSLLLKREGREISLKDWGLELVREMQGLAEIMDQKSGDGRYRRTLEIQTGKLQNIELTPSARVLNTLRTENLSWLELAGRLSETHQNILSKQFNTERANLSPQFSDEARRSFELAKNRKASDDCDFSTFLARYQEA